MKAKEWAVCFKQNDVQAMNDYIKETLELIQKRGNSPSAIEGAVKEQINKFHAVCKLSPDMDSYWFEEMFEQVAPNYYSYYCKEWYKRKEKVHRKFINARYQQALKEIEEYTDPTIRLGLLFAAILEKIDSNKEFEETYAYP